MNIGRTMVCGGYVDRLFPGLLRLDQTKTQARIRPSIWWFDTTFMSGSWPVPEKQFDEIWSISDKPEFAWQLGNFINYKVHGRKVAISRTEHAFDLVLHMQTRIEMEGFFDLYYQAYTLSDCLLVENVLREIGADRLADLFLEAKIIYMQHKIDLTEEEFRKLDSFDLPEPDGSRFSEIEEQVYADDSQLFELGERLADYARKHRDEFSK
jgi:hypothetical protein